jgi:transcriptional regulator with XRE-family HTH domain
MPIGVQPKRCRFGNHFLRAWREYAQFTQKDVEKKAGIEQSALSKLETGKTPYDEEKLEALARLYRCRPADLLGPPPQNN